MWCTQCISGPLRRCCVQWLEVWFSNISDEREHYVLTYSYIHLMYACILYNGLVAEVGHMKDMARMALRGI